MKKLLLFLGIALAAIGCTKSEIEETASPTGGEISFSAGVSSATISGVSTRVSAIDDCSWADSGDKIGIYTNQPDEKNLKFSVDKYGNMTSESKLYTLDGNKKRTYYAYHPYMDAFGTLVDNNNAGFFIDSKESKKIYVKRATVNSSYYSVPLLYATTTTNDVNVKLKFDHKLVRADFKFKAGGADITDLNDVTAVTLKGANTYATFSIERGEFNDDATTGDISLDVDDVKKGKITTYLIPQATVSGNVTIEITADGKTFTTPINTDEWEGDKFYKYNVTVGKEPIN